MSIDQLGVGTISILGIIGTYWYFLNKKETVTNVTDSIDIVVSGGYSPSTIQIPYGKTTKISFIRTDSSSCLEEVVLSDFKIKKYLPLDEKVTIDLTPQKKGEFQFSCGMNMYYGKIIVQDPVN